MSFYVCRLGFPWQEFFGFTAKRFYCLVYVFLLLTLPKKSYTTSVIFYYFGGGIWHQVGHLFKLNWLNKGYRTHSYLPDDETPKIEMTFDVEFVLVRIP